VTASWKAENATSAATDPTFSAVEADFETLRGHCIVSNELLQDSVNIDQMIEATFSGSFAAEIDRVCFSGTGSTPEPLGIENYTSVNSVLMGTNGAKLSSVGYNKILDAIHALGDSGINNVTAMVTSWRTFTDLAKLVDGDSNPLTKPDLIKSIPILPTNVISDTKTIGSATSACSSIILGDFTRLGLIYRLNLTSKPLVERYAENYQTGFIGALRMDAVSEHDEAFCKITGILKEAGSTS
jgi:HK97 family phage major capsid protein